MSKLASASLALVGAAVLTGCPAENRCPQGQVWNGQYCVGQAPQCPPGQMWNGQFCAPAGPQCPPGQSWNGQACVGGAPQCPPGQSWNGQACVGAPPQCPPGQTWNGQACVGGAPPPPPPQGCGQATTTDASVAQPMIAPLVAQHVPAGARAVGPAIYGNFSPGQCMEMQVQLQPGRCYTVVGAGGPGVQNLDVKFVPPIPNAPPVAEDQTQGSQAVLGGKPNCFQGAPFMPTPMNLVVRVTAGQGPVGVQLYEK